MQTRLAMTNTQAKRFVGKSAKPMQLDISTLFVLHRLNLSQELLKDKIQKSLKDIFSCILRIFLGYSFSYAKREGEDNDEQT